MAPTKSNDRESARRLRGYQARGSLHETQTRRRYRDNLVAGIGVIVIVALAAITQVLYFSVGPGTVSASASTEPSASATPDAEGNTGDVPSKDLAENRSWTGTLTINSDDLGISLDGAAAPQAVSSFISLAQNGFYKGLSCHRLTTSGLYVLQCGDPDGNGTGGPGYSYGPVENAPEDGVYPAGTIAMARQGGNGYSMGSQFFIVYQDTTLPADAAGGYTVLGTITSGLDALKANVIEKGLAAGSSSGDGAPAVTTTITDVTVQ